MTIKNNSVVAIDYTLRNDDGEVLDTNAGQEPLEYLHGHSNIVPGLEEALAGKQAGDAVNVVVPPEKGYGQRDPERVVKVPRDRLPDDLSPEVGMMLNMETDDGYVIPLTVAEVETSTVTMDANHQLAGQTLHFDVTVREVRDATQEELSHGHVHDPNGSH